MKGVVAELKSTFTKTKEGLKGAELMMFGAGEKRGSGRELSGVRRRRGGGRGGGCDVK